MNNSKNLMRTLRFEGQFAIRSNAYGGVIYYAAQDIYACLGLKWDQYRAGVKTGYYQKLTFQPDLEIKKSRPGRKPNKKPSKRNLQMWGVTLYGVMELGLYSKQWYSLELCKFLKSKEPVIYGSRNVVKVVEYVDEESSPAPLAAVNNVVAEAKPDDYNVNYNVLVPLYIGDKEEAEKYLPEFKRLVLLMYGGFNMGCHLLPVEEKDIMQVKELLEYFGEASEVIKR